MGQWGLRVGVLNKCIPGYRIDQKGKTLLGELFKFECSGDKMVVLYQCWFPDLQGWTQGRYKSVLFVGNYTLQDLGVTGHQVCSSQKVWR